MLHFLQIKGKTFHQQKDYYSFYCGGLKPNPMSLRYACTPLDHFTWLKREEAAAEESEARVY